MNGANILKEEVDLRNLAMNALNPIQKKLQGIYNSWGGPRRVELEVEKQ